ncbi:heptosyltransferase-1 [Pelosinus fermentans]|uniref:Glycosyl transferase family 9 n=1 Tax=Pelosinus fermentans B4 TaxID=1149862 RepID=I9B128_9FIRM|nr:glycosyl transferase family 9 [Pelosinus fermentans B4]EIW21978.1 glycosyl transferase family 9 [Pelosinus fermentans A11]OAM95171.1 glycosyl transferase family 9 [Pelosinus fermentans DSM 17108]SDR24280.1 heptosyltransferase-1 [Pelosinus fermentans]
MLLDQFLSHQKFPRILILRLSSIGDVLQASPVARELRKAFPSAYISWLIESKSQEVIQDNSNLDSVFVWPRKEWNAEAKKTGDYHALVRKNLAFVKQIRKEKFQISIDLHGMFRSGLLGYLSGAKYRLCLPNSREYAEHFANVKVKTGNFPTVFSRYLSVLKEFGIHRTEPEMEMQISLCDERFAMEFMANYGLKKKGFFILNPATSQPNKCWSTDKFAKLGDMLVDTYQLPILLLGAKSDRPLTKKIVDGMRHKPIDATGLVNLKQLGAITKQARTFISGDTGPLYIAQAVGTPTVAIFGPTNANYYSLEKKNHIFIQGRDACTNNVTIIELYRAVRQLMP